jgi:hypothetical protein
MRTLTAAAVAATLLAPAAASATPAKPGCRAVLTDPKGDTYDGLTAEPAADITNVTLCATKRALTLGVGIADIDAPLVLAPGGRSLWLTFSAGEERSFVVRWVQGLDATYARLYVGDVDESPGSQSAFLGHAVGELTWTVDAKANQVRVDVPLTLLGKYSGSTRKGTAVLVRDLQTYDVEGVSEYHTGGSIDTTDLGSTGRVWRIGDC